MSALAAEGAGTEPMGAGAVALHPERTDDPATVRWVVAGGLPEGLDPQAVTTLAAAVAGPGVLARVEVGADDVLTTLAEGRDWRAEGGAVRSAVARAVAHGRRAEGTPSDERLRAVATRIVAEEVNPYAATHGGALRVVDVHDGQVEVALRGACHGCPAAAFTVQGRLGRRLAGTAGFEGVRVEAPRVVRRQAPA